MNSLNGKAVPPALVIMARTPEAGQVKTRMMPRLTPEQSSSLYRAFLEDTISLSKALSEFPTFLAFSPTNKEDFFRSLTPRAIKLMPQVEGNLGQKIYHALLALEKDYSPLIVIGSDMPTLQPEALSQALEALRLKDICLGPCYDGGYYLLGMRRVNPAVFDDIPWGTPEVLEKTLSKAKENHLSVGMLPTRGDVDFIEDLERLKTDLQELRRLPGAILPRRTIAWLEQHPTV